MLFLMFFAIKERKLTKVSLSSSFLIFQLENLHTPSMAFLHFSSLLLLYLSIIIKIS